MEQNGIKSNNDKSEEKGYILIDGGAFNITSGEDAIQAETNLTINEGDFTVISGGGNEKSTKTHNEGFGGGPRLMVIREEGMTLLMITEKYLNHRKWKWSVAKNA